MRHVIGIDASLSGTAATVLKDNGEYVSEHFKTPSGGKGSVQRVQRCLGIVAGVMALVDQFHPELCVIEGYSFMSSSAAYYLGELGGILRCDLVDTEVPVYEVAPNSLKKFATGKGNGDKTLVIASVTHRWGAMFRTNDQYDSFVAAQIAGCIAGFVTPQTTSMRQVVAVVKGEDDGTQKRKSKHRSKA